jgi:hypothetical protein
MEISLAADLILIFLDGAEFCFPRRSANGQAQGQWPNTHLHQCNFIKGTGLISASFKTLKDLNAMETMHLEDTKLNDFRRVCRVLQILRITRLC